MINCLFLILISLIIINNDLALVKAKPYIFFGSIFPSLSYVFSGNIMSKYGNNDEPKVDILQVQRVNTSLINSTTTTRSEVS